MDNIKAQSKLNALIALLSKNSSVDLITPYDSRYANARLIYNRMHDSFPGLIVRTLNVDALRAVINYAVKHFIDFAVRGGGHHIGGFGTCQDGIVIDFSPFKNIKIDTQKNIVTTDPGVCLGDIDTVLVSQGYVLPTGTISETGLAGLTLGGGIGWLIGQYGLTCDQLCGADVLLADGRVVQAENPAHNDLLWALKGGGGNFGIVLAFRYRLNPLPKTMCGSGIVDWKNASHVMKKLVCFLKENCPPTLTVAPAFTKNAIGDMNLRIDFCCANGTDADMRKLLSISEFVEWVNVREWEYVAWQKNFDFLLTPPLRGYWKASYVEIFTPEMVDSICHSFENSPLCECTILFEHLHGAFKNYGQETSAFPLRNTHFGILFSARWLEAKDDAHNILWVRQSYDAIDPVGKTGAYSNYSSADDIRAMETLLVSTRSKISDVKSFYDPLNVFRRNHNVIPRKNISFQSKANE